MQRVIERGCGLDVHKKSIAACVRIPDADEERRQEVRTFGTTAAELLALRDWLDAHGVTHVAMESTGVYWKPVFYVLEEAMTCVLVNPVHMRQVPGRKTDVQDPGVAGPHALSQDDRAGTDARHQSAAQGAGGCRHQAGVRRH
jgi:transposase